MAGAGASSTPSSPACVIDRARAPGLTDSSSDGGYAPLVLPRRAPPRLPSPLVRSRDQRCDSAGPGAAGLTLGQVAKEFPGKGLPAGWDGARQLRLLRTSRGNRMKTLGDVFDDQRRRPPGLPAAVPGPTPPTLRH